MINDTVVAAIDRERLSDALTALHRGGFGANARVMDGERGDLAGQLTRAGIEPELAHDVATPSTVLLAVFAPGRVSPVIELVQRAGARTVHLLARGGPLASVTPATMSGRHARASSPGRRRTERRLPIRRVGIPANPAPGATHD